ncbi:diguanylate cyclase domain-containing protein [Ectothiorhodospira lacustris]|uniref:diguanylate cyclase domain-containing protein n=1 Tax=Ectothiorhodospira lacustris TaxID=2899127 RepID=UPI001EE8B8C1|nr:diguanylate cyclase [Ectothiorhodospira lacustris]MCG5509775.1 diguanylate cyclase [Ectothiorhodospira lacustris]MCG5522311.1 diguanylate cyclase [Ectothiorhodospira lacustris]
MAATLWVKVLIRMGQALADTVRRGDVMCRYGGEAFVALLLGAGEALYAAKSGGKDRVVVG